MATLRYIIFILLFWSNNLFGQFKNPEFLNIPSIYKLNGRIDSIKSKVNYCDLPNYLNKCYDEVLWFDNRNTITKKVYHDDFGRVVTTSFSYDKNNNLLEEVTTENRNEIKRTIFKYDNSNSLVEIKSLKGNEIIFINKSEYKAKKKVKETILDRDEKPQNIFSYEYNSSGELMEKIEEIPSLNYGTAGFNKRKYFYDKTGLLIKEMEFEKNDKLVSTFKYYYNENNQPIRQEYFGEISNLYDSKTEYRYKDDYLAEVVYNNNQSDLNEVKKYEYKFDSHKNLTHIIISKGDNKILDVMYIITYK